MPTKAPWACKCGKRVAAGQPCPCCSKERKRRYEITRPSASARGYDGKWRREREAYLKVNQWCVRHAARGEQVRATVINHKIPHKGNVRIFWNRRNWEPVCDACHNGPIQSEEANAFKFWGYSIPGNVQPSLSPVTLVCGPPASGKSTYVKARAKPGDLIVDLDDCCVAVGGRRWESDNEVLRKAFVHRDRMIRSLADKPVRMAWIVVSAPKQAERSQWCQALGKVSVVVLDTPAETCIERINSDPSRAHAVKRLLRKVDEWFNPSMGRGASISGELPVDRRGERHTQQCGIGEFLGGTD